MKLSLSLVLITTILGLGCAAHRSILPDPEEVRISREAPSSKKNCKEIGPISGTTQSTEATQEDALNDLKQEAANKGANYVVVKEYSSYGTAVTGVAYDCPH